MKKTTLLTLLLTASLGLSGCFWKKKTAAPAAAATTNLQSDAQAVEFIASYIRSNGGDSSKYEITARAGREGQWSVTAFHIAYPERKGTERFAPGDYTIYVVNSEGKIINSLPGQKPS